MIPDSSLAAILSASKWFSPLGCKRVMGYRLHPAGQVGSMDTWACECSNSKNRCSHYKPQTSLNTSGLQYKVKVGGQVFWKSCECVELRTRWGRIFKLIRQVCLQGGWGASLEAFFIYSYHKTLKCSLTFQNNGCLHALLIYHID